MMVWKLMVALAVTDLVAILCLFLWSDHYVGWPDEPPEWWYASVAVLIGSLVAAVCGAVWFWAFGA